MDDSGADEVDPPMTSTHRGPGYHPQFSVDTDSRSRRWDPCQEITTVSSVAREQNPERSRTTDHNWIQKAGLQPEKACTPNHDAVDKSVIQVNCQRYRLYAAVDSDVNRLLHIRQYPTKTTALTEMFFSELREKYPVNDAVFLVDRAPWLQAALHHRLRFQHETQRNRNAVERFFKELKRRTNQFYNHFRNANPDTAET